MTESLRVTHVVFDLDGGGLETLVGEMARRWSRSDVVMSIVTLSGRVGRTGASVRDLVDQFHILKPMPTVSMALPLGIARALRRTRADVVHLHSGAWFKSAWAARVAGVPRVVYTEHGREHVDSPASIWLDRQAWRLTDVVVTVSERLQSYMETTLHVPRQRIRTIVNGVDTSRFAPGSSAAASRARLGIAPDAWVIGSVGRLEKVKAYDRLVEALSKLRSVDGAREVHLVICGEGGQRAALEAQIAAAGLDSFVHLPGWIDDLASWYRLFDVFALSSDSEGLSVSLLEAMACGCAPVVTDVGANAAVLGSALRDQVVPAGSLDGLVAALASTLAVDGRRRTLGEIARERVTRHFGSDRMVIAYERLYRELAAPAWEPRLGASAV